MSKPNQTSFKKGNVPWNTGKKMSDKHKKILSEARMKSKHRTGKLHPRWKGGKRRYYCDVANRLLQEAKKDKICFICKSNKKIHIHHKDRNWKNNTLNNLVYLCLSCHLKIHHKEDKTKCICQWCNKVFYSGRVSRMFCSSSCRCKEWKSRSVL